MPKARHRMNHGRDSTAVVSQPGAGRPFRSASYLGVRQATARTVKLTVSAATAPAMVSPSGMGRSFDPPIPWASTSPSEPPSEPPDDRTRAVKGLLHLELDDRLLERVGLDHDDARLVELERRQRGRADAVLELVLRGGVDVDLALGVRLDHQLDGLVDLHV